MLSPHANRLFGESLARGNESSDEQRSAIGDTINMTGLRETRFPQIEW